MAQEQVIVEAQKEPDDCKEDSANACAVVEPEVKECDCKKYTLIFNFH